VHVQVREFSFAVQGERADIWSILHPRFRRNATGENRVLRHGDLTIEIVHAGDEHGEGLVRTCTYRMPRYVAPSGVARSWECVTEVHPEEFSSRYEAIASSPWAFASGWHRLDDLGDGRTDVCFGETYKLASRWLRPVLEHRAHAFITRENERIMRGAIDEGLAAIETYRRRRAQETA
jgi:hypothetical protein